MIELCLNNIPVPLALEIGLNKYVHAVMQHLLSNRGVVLQQALIKLVLYQAHLLELVHTDLQEVQDKLSEVFNVRILPFIDQETFGSQFVHELAHEYSAGYAVVLSRALHLLDLHVAYTIFNLLVLLLVVLFVLNCEEPSNALHYPLHHISAVEGVVVLHREAVPLLLLVDTHNGKREVWPICQRKHDSLPEPGHK